MQARQQQWERQWEVFRNDEPFLFADWIYPVTLEDLRGKDILECGCGSGQHAVLMAQYAHSVTSVDLNTTEIARRNAGGTTNIDFVEADIASMQLGRKFDVVISVGVVHHTDDPEQTVANMIHHLRPGGLLVVWVYSREGNFLVRRGVEPFRRFFLRNMSRDNLLLLSRCITALMVPFIYSIYLLPLRFLPFFDYFANFRKLSFSRNVLNVFDKLNAPQVDFISRERIEQWFGSGRFTNVSITPYCGVSWRGSGVLT